MSGKTKIAIAAGVVLVVGALVVVNLKFDRQKKVTVQTEKIEYRRLKSIVTASGKIKPKKQVNISASTIGKVTRLAVAEGDLVTAGQFLLQIDPAPLAAEVAALKASIAAGNAALAQSRAGLDQSQLELRRLTELKKHDLATDQDIDRAKTSVQVETARSHAAEREVERLEANLRSASHMLSQVTFRSPLAGLITVMNIEEGENVVTGTMNNPGTVLMTIADLSEIEAEIDVDETDVVGIRIGQAASVSIDAFPGKKFKAEVVKVGNSAVAASSAAATEQTTNFRVTLALREAVPGIKPALSCSADIVTAVRDRSLAVPIQSMTIRTLPKEKAAAGAGGDAGGVRAASGPGPAKPARSAPTARPSASASADASPDASDEEKSRDELEKEGVFVVRGGVAHFVTVKTGISGERFFEILDGLKEGDEVITGTYQAIRDLKDGDGVKVDNTPKKKEGEETRKG
jgi:HlyD family secretion protein